MRVIFAGTPEFARVALAQLHAAGHDIRLVLTQPDRPAGRGMKLQASAVKQFALERGMAVAQPRSLRLDGKYPQDAQAARAAIDAAQAQVMVVAAYGLILPQWVLDAMQGSAHPAQGAGGGSLGCLNIHASLLPRWRGAAPIHRAIEAGDTETGVTIMQMDAGLDTGGMLLTEQLPIAGTERTATLHDKLAAMGGRLIVRALQLAAHPGLVARAQPAQGVCYAHKIEKTESAIDWRQSALQIERRVRAFDPFPGCSTQLGTEVLKIWRSDLDGLADSPLARTAASPGQIVQADAAGIRVQCGQGVLRLTELQRAGGKRLAAQDLLHGFPLTAGQCFVVPPTAAPGSV